MPVEAQINCDRADDLWPDQWRQSVSECLVMIPTFDERENISLLVPEIFAMLPDINIMIIDDNSPDGTAGQVIELSRRYRNLRLYSRERKEGLGNAYADAFTKVLAETHFRNVITMDADGSHDARYLPAIIAKLAIADVVVASRYVAGGSIDDWAAWRRILSRCGNLYARLMTGLSIKDVTAGFIGINRDTLSRISLSHAGTSGYAFLIELKFHLVHQGQAKVAETPIVFGRRRHGKSKMSWHIVTEGLRVPLWLLLRRL